MVARKYERPPAVPPMVSRLAAVQRTALRLARALRADSLTAADRETLAVWMDALAGSERDFAAAVRAARTAPKGSPKRVIRVRPDAKSVAAVDALLVALGGTRASRLPRKNATNYEAIAYHWVIAKRLRLPRSHVADHWKCEPKTVTDAMRRYGEIVQQRLDWWLADGKARGFTETEVLRSEERRAQRRRRI